jgi:hypothetical protein
MYNVQCTIIFSHFDQFEFVLFEFEFEQFVN